MTDGRDARSDYEKTIVANVEKHGWHSTYVMADGDAPGFGYSVGFTKTLGAPEFIIFGLPQALVHSMLWEIFEQIRDGKAVEEGARWSNLIDGYDCISREVLPGNIVRDYLNSAIWFNGPPPGLRVFQMVWPSNGPGLFPWERDCAQIVRDAQPALYEPKGALS